MDTRTFKVLLILMIGQLLAIASYGQLYMTRTGETSFFSETPLENIAAVNKQVLVILNPANGEIAIKMQQRNFHFPNKLMEEHFNENYMETENIRPLYLRERSWDQLITAKTEPILFMRKVCWICMASSKIAASKVRC